MTNDVLKNYNVVVFTDLYDRVKLINANEFCRANNIGFVYAGNLGLYGFTFVDYGLKHNVFDTNGEQVKNTIIVNVTNEKEAVVTCHEDRRHGFEDGDTVILREIEGMSQINGREFKIKDTKSHSFTLVDGDTT